MSNIQVWEQKKLMEIKKLYAPNLSNDEFAIFSEIGKLTWLNPFLREIWAVKYGNQPASIFIGRDGYRKSAQSSPLYDWHSAEDIRENDTFSVNDGKIIHSMNMKDRGKIVGAYALAQRRWSSRPNYVRVDLSEYNSGKSVWSTKPSTMIKKVAEAQVLRMTFQELFAGTYDESEQWDEKEDKKPKGKIIEVNPQVDIEDDTDPDLLYEQYLSRLEGITSIDDLSALFNDVKNDKKDLWKEYTEDIIDRIKSAKMDIEKKNTVVDGGITPPPAPAPKTEVVDDPQPTDTVTPPSNPIIDRRALSPADYDDVLYMIKWSKDAKQMEEARNHIEQVYARGRMSESQYESLKLIADSLSTF